MVTLPRGGMRRLILGWRAAVTIDLLVPFTSLADNTEWEGGRRWVRQRERRGWADAG